MRKNSGRTLPSVYRDNTDSSLEDSFISNLQQNATRSPQSIYEEISSILGNTKSKYSSVEEAVQDMKERTGLKAYLEATASNELPEVFAEIPEMRTFIDNFVKDRPGTSIESVVHDLLKIDSIRDRLPERSDVTDDVRRYINDKIAESLGKKDFNRVEVNLGKADNNSDTVSDDPLGACEPSKV